MSKAIAIPECNKEIGCMKEEISISPSEKRDGAIGLFSRLLRLDQLGKKSSIESPTSSTPPTTYYGVYIPCEIKKGPDEEALHVYKNRSEALELVRRYKLARFKAFQNHQDAVSFALRGAEPVDNTDGNDSSLMGEKPYPFKAPSPQDMVSLRKAIETGIINTVCDRIWDNPRYLVSSGNTPSILQEGSRYNALHVAAKAANAEICNLILTTVGNPMFVQTLYGADADHESCREFAAILVDRYLNTPDKAMNETPLHFAAKFGAEQVVEVLTSFPQCNRDAVNKFGEQAKDIVCKRASKVDAACATRIRGMLRDQYYVPVLHAEDDSAPPTVGRPFTPARHPELTSSPLCSPLEIRSFAGPMEEGEANSFHRRFKTPPRVPLRPPTFRLQETTKGLEHYGRNLAEELKVGWSEYWPFLDTFTNLRSSEGLALLENYLKSKYEDACSSIFMDSCIQSQTDNLSLSRISLNATQSPVKDVMSPMSELCVAMKTCTISSDKRPIRSGSCVGASHWRKTDPIRQRLCRQPTAKQTVNGDQSPVMNHTVSPLLCVERTCQVFARRLADALVFSLTAEADVAADSLKSEARHLQHTIYSYLDDERFKAIDFSRIHCRLAQLVAHSLMEQTNNLDDINDLIEFFVKIQCPNDDIFSSDDERKTVNHRGKSKLKLSHVIAGYVRCIAGFLHGELIEAEPRGPTPAPNRLSEYLNVSQVDCVEAWSKASKCRCDWRVDLFERNTKRNSSFRKNRSILSTSPKNDGFIRRLTFDNDIGDGKGACIVPYSAGAEAEVRSSNSPGGDCVPLSPQLPPTPDMSDDESLDEYYTASDHSSGEEDNMFDASDRAIADAFIYGEEPSKMDQLVFDALSTVHVNVETYPYVFRWRHTVALYTPEERKKWRAVNGRGDVSVHATLGGGSPMQAHTSTPRRERERKDDTRMVPLQVSSWLRVTGPNSPRSALASLNVDHNVSFGF